jgi:hypothetical protein
MRSADKTKTRKKASEPPRETEDDVTRGLGGVRIGDDLVVFLPFTLFGPGTIRVKGNPYLVITRQLPGKVEGKVRVKSFHYHLRVIHFTR